MSVFKDKFIFSNEFKELNLNIKICDIGASGGIGEPWNLLEDKLDIIGFEPDLKSFNSLVKEFPDNKYFNIGLWSKETVRKFYVTQQDYNNNYSFGTSSMYPPNISKNSLNYGNIDLGRVTYDTIDIKCNNLDNILLEDKNNIPDFIKIDTQGSEYEILIGAEKLLARNAPVITLETWTEEIYKDIPLSYKIMELMEQYGYMLFKTELAASRCFDSGENIHCKARHCGLELFYVKDYHKMSSITESKLIKQIAIVELFGFRDYALFLLNRLKIVRNDKYNIIREVLIKNGQNMDQKYPSIRY